jgi:hypothetical protein
MAYSGAAKGSRDVDRTAWKKVLELLLYLLCCALIGTGFLLAYRLPHGGSSRPDLVSWLRPSYVGRGAHLARLDDDRSRRYSFLAKCAVTGQNRSF